MSPAVGLTKAAYCPSQSDHTLPVKSTSSGRSSASGPRSSAVTSLLVSSTEKPGARLARRSHASCSAK